MRPVRLRTDEARTGPLAHGVEPLAAAVAAAHVTHGLGAIDVLVDAVVHVLTEVKLVQVASDLALGAQLRFVLRTTRPQVGEVVEHEAEDVGAVLDVLGRVEDVGVPDRVELLGGDDRLVRVHRRQLEEAAVLGDETVRLVDGHADLPEVGVDQLVRDGLEIELIDHAKLVLDFRREHRHLQIQHGFSFRRCKQDASTYSSSVQVEVVYKINILFVLCQFIYPRSIWLTGFELSTPSYGVGAPVLNQSLRAHTEY